MCVILKCDCECALCSKEDIIIHIITPKLFQALKMAGTDHASLVKCSSGNTLVEGEDSSRTAKCLRGRLLAERLASRNAREEAEQLGIKVLEVENLLKQEAKSRKRAEKKLQFLMKRLECMNISYAADESEQSSVSCSEMGSNENSNIHSSPSAIFELEASDLISCADEHEQEPRQPQSPADEEGVNDSMALVPVSMPPEDERIEPEVLDATVRQVLVSLRRAKEQLQSSMERRRRRMNINMIRVG